MPTPLAPDLQLQYEDRRPGSRSTRWMSDESMSERQRITGAPRPHSRQYKRAGEIGGEGAGGNRIRWPRNRTLDGAQRKGG